MRRRPLYPLSWVDTSRVHRTSHARGKRVVTDSGMWHVPKSIALNFGLVMGVALALLVGVAITGFAMVARKVSQKNSSDEAT